MQLREFPFSKIRYGSCMNPFRTLQGWCLHMRGLDPQMLRNSSEASKTPPKKERFGRGRGEFFPSYICESKESLVKLKHFATQTDRPKATNQQTSGCCVSCPNLCELLGLFLFFRNSRCCSCSKCWQLLHSVGCFL